MKYKTSKRLFGINLQNKRIDDILHAVLFSQLDITINAQITALVQSHLYRYAWTAAPLHITQTLQLQYSLRSLNDITLSVPSVRTVLGTKSHIILCPLDLEHTSAGT